MLMLTSFCTGGHGTRDRCILHMSLFGYRYHLGRDANFETETGTLDRWTRWGGGRRSAVLAV